MSSPIRRQYLEIKARHRDAVLFFRLGDFYETFDEDAELVSRELDITLTSKPMGKGLRVPLAGVPLASVDRHLARLIAAGHRVAICEQLEDARATKGLVARGVVRVVSPGTALEPALLEAGRNHYCVALAGPEPGLDGVGLAAADLSTGEFRVCQLPGPAAAALSAARLELERLGARELILATGGAAAAEDWGDLARSERPAAWFEPAAADQRLREHYGLAGVEGLGLGERPAAVAAAGALLAYLLESQPRLAPPAPKGEGAPLNAESQPRLAPRPPNGESAALDEDSAPRLAHLGRPRPYEPGATMQLDQATQRALGLFEPGRSSAPGGAGGAGSLLGLLDGCATAAGRRLLRQRLARPLLDRGRIERRLDWLALLVAEPARRRRLGKALAEVPDLERLLGRVSAGLAAPAELARLGHGLTAAAALRGVLDLRASFGVLSGQAEPNREAEPAAEAEAGVLGAMVAEVRPCEAAQRAIAEQLAEQPAADFEQGGVLRPGADAEADRQRARLGAARAAIADLELRERERTGIANLRVGYHRSFGYYLELRGRQVDRAPPEWERRQTLAGGQRFVSAELRALEHELLVARDELATRERALFAALCRTVSGEAEAIRALAQGVARLDVAWALATLAAERDWVRPELDHSDLIALRGSRHPLVEAALEPGRFVPNDLRLDASQGQVLLVTGPNMAGKSTYLRQCALIVLLAQIGSFVPAAEARIGLVDRIFARVGAQDDLAAGQSTFLVEMLETAAILSSASERSLLVLDEIGRGTSTYDGLAIAQALLERLVAGRERGPRTLFATHFHELTALAGAHERIVNATVAVAEGGAGGEGEIRFLYRIVPGAADRSYGIQVAAMAGLPPGLVARAREILTGLEGRDGAVLSVLPAGVGLLSLPEAAGLSAPTAWPASALAQDLATLDVDGLTPLEAIGALYALRDQARDELSPAAPTAPVAPAQPAEPTGPIAPAQPGGPEAAG